MARQAFSLSILGCVLGVCVSAQAQPSLTGPPVTYEVLLNGESFRVDGNRVVKLESKTKPGTSYEIAVRISPVQQIRLNSVQLEYDLPARISDDHGKEQRTLEIKHELGSSIMLTDLGQAVDAAGQEKALMALVDYSTAKFEKQNAEDVKVGPTAQRKFAEGRIDGVGTTIRYQDIKGFGHTCLVYVLTGPKFTVGCVAEFMDRDRDDVLSLIKKTMDSIQAIP